MRKTAQLLTLLFAVIGVASLLTFHFSLPTIKEFEAVEDPSVHARNVGLINSDQVDGIIWAEAALHAKRPLNPNFSYPYAIPYGANLILVPFVRMFGLRVLSNQLGMFLFSLIVLGVAVYLIRPLSCNWKDAAIGTAVIFLAFRSRMGANLLHHVLYYQLGFVCGMGMLGALFWIARRGTFTLSSAVLLVIFALWGGANGSTTIALAVFPVVVALSVIRFKDVDGVLIHVYWRCLAAIGVGLFLGLVAYRVGMLGTVEGSYIEGAGSYSFLNSCKWTENISVLPKTWINLFFTRITEGVQINTLDGVETLFSLGMSIFVGVFPFYCLWRYAKLSIYERLVLVYGASVWLVCLMQFVLLRGPIDRLLYNGLLANFLLLGIAVVQSFKANKHFIWLGPSLSLILASWCFYFVYNATWKTDCTLLNELEARGLTQGCATYWKANGTTVHSGGKVRIGPIIIGAGGTIVPWRYNSDASWYRPARHGADCFLLLDADEWEKVQRAPNNTLFNLSKSHFVSQGFHVLVYSSSHWEKMLSGKVVSYNFIDDDGRWASGCTSGKEGRSIHPGGVSFGPYIALVKGVRCHVRITGRNLKTAAVSVYGVSGERVSLQPEYKCKTDSEMCFSFISEVDLEGLEVVIRNPSKTGDVILFTEVIDAAMPGD